jgi:hypothetical protein
MPAHFESWKLFEADGSRLLWVESCELVPTNGIARVSGYSVLSQS